MEEEVVYYSKDFDWNDLHEEVESAQERRYLLKEFPELGRSNQEFTALEVGCGAGSSAIPILRFDVVCYSLLLKDVFCSRATTTARVYACDLSEAAVSLTNKMGDKALNEQATSRLRTFVCDPSCEALPAWLACDACRASDFGIKSFLIFALSALADLDQMSNLLKECCSVLRPGGMLLFRDYGMLFLREVELEYCCIKLNHKTKVPMKRVWVHAKFMKPDHT
ncbi:methyltransferase-like protein [Selaginella moellendorffii]|uniref:methyltransferase-like protein n=1 Tax=Selaginella moellendorffii TaxID=88036 RepID=UPI000D1C37C5|nr:methyltransferase-like protein [Selaginella moellendorffii]|eukprot:XP_024525468.1 methyltransferase-like protein [Selaginella moellendorffii]